jgi:phage/plasmid-associated DNA primase
VLYGPPGTGKSTILNIIEWLFEGYTTTFDGKALGSSNASFATEVFRFNPLVAIQHDGDLSKIEDNARLNSIIAHEQMVMNEKYKSSYSSRIDAMLFIGSNQPVRISDAKSGIIRRLIDIHPTGVKFGAKHYQTLMTQIGFELGLSRTTVSRHI